MPTLFMIRGVPGSGKHTVAKIVAATLNWKLFWLHDLDFVYSIVGDHRVPRLQDDLCNAVLKHLCRKRESFIFVRSARDAQTIEDVKDLAAEYGYKLVLVNLKAKYETLLERVQKRERRKYRVCDKDGLDEYLSARPEVFLADEYVIATDNLTPGEIAKKIMHRIELVS